MLSPTPSKIHKYAHRSINRCLHAVELAIALVVVVVAAMVTLHVMIHIIPSLWHSLGFFSLTTKSVAFVSVHAVIIDILDIMIMLELAQIFIRMEDRNKISVTMIMDTAIIFCVREAIIAIYGNGVGLHESEFAAAVFVTLRILYGFVSQQRTESRNKQRGRRAGDNAKGEITTVNDKKETIIDKGD
jgi:uncharacterized membrane protein (DUF373 family)